MSRLVTTALVAASFTTAAAAAPYDDDRGTGRERPLPAAEHLTDGRVTLPPRAFVAFCSTYEDQCTRRGDSDTVTLDSDAWQALRDVNRTVNRRIISRSDAPGTDSWQLDVRAGDCDEYALEKRRALLDRGWPSSVLSLAAAYVPSGEAHLVLTVRTSRGDFVLDNLRDGVVAADSTGYRWIARQSTLHPRLWVRVVNPSVPVAVARLSSRPLRTADAARDVAPVTPVVDTDRDIARSSAPSSRRDIGRDIGFAAPRKAVRLSSRDIGFGIGD